MIIIIWFPNFFPYSFVSQRRRAQLQETRWEHEWTGGHFIHLQSIPPLRSMALCDLYVCSCRRHAHHDESDYSDIFGRCIGAGASLVACGLSVFGRRGCWFDGNLHHESKDILGWCVRRSVCIDHSAYRHYHYGESTSGIRLKNHSPYLSVC